MIFERFKNVGNFIDRHPLVVIMGLSLAIKLFLFSFDQVINTDGVRYIAAARHMASGNMAAALILHPMPAYPALLVIVHSMIPDWIVSARIIGVAAMVLVSIPIFSITRLLFDRQSAFWATLFFAVTPDANEQALMVIRDPVFLLIILTSLLFFLKGLQQRNQKFVLVSLLLTGLSFLFRVEAIVFAIAPIFFFSLKSLTSKDINFKKFARRSLLIWIAVPLILTLFIAVIFGINVSKKNRVDELLAEVNKLTQFEAFENYNKIYNYFKTIQSEPPFSGFSKSLPAIVRHWMPLIYTIGLLEYFIKQMFPLFLLPLLFTVYCYFSDDIRSISLDKQFVLLSWFIYMLLVLYSFMIRDFIQGRFLFVPAILLYPWVGRGIALVLKRIKGLRHARVLRFAIVLLLVTTPLADSVLAVTKSDIGAFDAGRFISKDENLVDAKILFSDTRQWLYANRSEAYLKIWNDAWILSKHIEDGQPAAIEQKAINDNADAIVLEINYKKLAIIPEFANYRVYQKFPSRKGVTVIYRRSN